MALASVVYHATKAEGGFDFAPDHELMKCALFCDRALMENLRVKLDVGGYFPFSYLENGSIKIARSLGVRLPGENQNGHCDKKLENG